jgi:hypothetical protein
VGVLALVLAIFFRSTLGVLLPLGVMGVTTVWTLGAYELAGFQLNAITGLLPPVLMVLTLAVSVHLIQGWLDAGSASGNRVSRMLNVVRRLAFPCFFCRSRRSASLARDQQHAGGETVRRLRGARVVIAFGSGTLVVGLPSSPPEAPRSRSTADPRLLSASTRGDAPRRVLAVFCALPPPASPGSLVHNNTDLVRFLKSARSTGHALHREHSPARTRSSSRARSEARRSPRRTRYAA